MDRENLETLLVFGEHEDAGPARAKAKFGEVAEAMLGPMEAAGGWVRGPQIHSLNPYGAFCRTLQGRSQVHGAEQYPGVTKCAHGSGEMKLQPGMCFAFEPSCGFGDHLVTIGGTVLVAENQAIELNPYTAQLLRAGM